jgi:hypothetical protein
MFAKSFEEKVKCPNCCFNGKVLNHDSERALHDLVNCEFCKGSGSVLIKNLPLISKKFFI